jgi:hypothetical protein
MLLVAVAVVGAWNASRYPPGLSYDGGANLAYADGIMHGQLPAHTGEFFQPPGFYALASVVDRLAEHAPQIGDPHRAAQAADVALFVASIALVWLVLRELWPGRPWRWLIGSAFVAAVPAAERAAAMFHPEMLDLFLTTLAILLALRLLRRPSLALAASTGAALGLGQLVRAWALPILAAIAITLLLGGRRKDLAVVLAVGLLIPAPWYVRQTVVYGTPLPFNRPAPHTPIWERRSTRFYLGLGVPQVITRPYRPAYVNEAIPTTYTELWGDYFGHWRWNGSKPPPSKRVQTELTLQSLAGLLPTALALVGWLMLLARARRRQPELILIALVPLLGLALYAFFTISHPSADGDVLKGTYLLATTTGWAAGFAYAVTQLPRRLLVTVLVALAVAAAVDIPFLVYM